MVTGASSGIGRQVCIDLSGAGCRVVCAARRQAELEETARLCRDAATASGEVSDSTLVVSTDVTVEADVQRLVARTLERWGTIDTWIHCAGTTLFSPLSEGTLEEHCRVVEINLFGAMIAARAIVPVFRRQGRGVLINVGSLLSRVGQPFVPSYAISKHGLRGMSESLRVELADEPDIHVCAVYPYAVDTPHFETGANEMGHPARTMPPVQSPEAVARAIVDMARRPRREVHVPKLAAIAVLVQRLFPETTERLLLHALRRWHFDPQHESPSTGNLFSPKPDAAAVHGHRPPRIGAPRLAAWMIGELAVMRLGDLASTLFGAPSRASASSEDSAPQQATVSGEAR